MGNPLFIACLLVFNYQQLKEQAVSFWGYHLQQYNDYSWSRESFMSPKGSLLDSLEITVEGGGSKDAGGRCF